MPTLTLKLSDEINDCLAEIAQRNSISKAEAIKRAFALLKIADDQKHFKGHCLGLIRKREDCTYEVVGRITGI